MGRRWGGIGKLGIPKGQHKRWTTNGRRGRGAAKNRAFAFVYSWGEGASVEYTSYQGGNRVWNNRQKHHQEELDVEDELSSSTSRGWMTEWRDHGFCFNKNWTRNQLQLFSNLYNLPHQSIASLLIWLWTPEQSSCYFIKSKRSWVDVCFHAKHYFRFCWWWTDGEMLLTGWFIVGLPVTSSLSFNHAYIVLVISYSPWDWQFIILTLFFCFF